MPTACFNIKFSGGLLIISKALTRLFWFFLFLGFLSLKPIGLSHFWHSVDEFANTLEDCPVGTSILIGAFTTGICDLVTFLMSVNASGN